MKNNCALLVIVAILFSACTKAEYAVPDLGGLYNREKLNNYEGASMHEFSEFIISIFNPITEIIDLIAILFMLWGLVKALFDYFVLRIKNKTLNRNDIKVVRCYIGSYLLLGLEIMIVADVITTVLNQTKDDLIFLGGIVIIRTILSYFLNKEIGEMESDL